VELERKLPPWKTFHTFLPGDKSDEMAQTGPIYIKGALCARKNDFGLCACDLLKASPMKVLIGVQEVAAV
jgi:hypothetical protein